MAKKDLSKSALDDSQALLQLKKIEIRFHIAKLIVLTLVSLLTAFGVILAIRTDNDRTRDQINCIVNGFLSPPEQVPDAVHRCHK